MIGEAKFQVIIPGNQYRLSTGAMIDFLDPESGSGVTNEELIGILLHRLRVQAHQCGNKCTSRAITALEAVEEILWRHQIEKGLKKKARVSEAIA